MPSVPLNLVERADALYRDLAPDIEIQREKPEHRIIVLLKAQGFSNTEISAHVGMGKEQVGRVLRQPWARQRLLDLLAEKGGSLVEKFLSGETMDSLHTLVEIRDDKNVHPSVRASTANAILDRALGKAIQKTVNLNAATEIPLERLDHELEKLRAEEQTLLGRRTVTGN